MANLKDRKFQVNKAYDEVFNILTRPQHTPSDVYKQQRKLRHLLKEINQSGYETGFKDAVEFLEEDTYLVKPEKK